MYVVVTIFLLYDYSLCVYIIVLCIVYVYNYVQYLLAREHSRRAYLVIWIVLYYIFLL